MYKSISYFSKPLNSILNSSLFRASGVYTVTSIVNAAIPFLLLPILTRYLTPEDYGIVSMFALLVSIFSVFTGLSVHGAINRVFFEKNINFKEYTFNCIVILTISTVATLVISIVFLDFISKISSVPKNWITIAIFISFIQFLILSTLSIYQARMFAKQYALLQFSQALLNAIFSITLVVIAGLGWEGRVLGQLISVFLLGLICLFILKNWTEWRFNRNYIKHALNFGIPLIPHTLGGMFVVFTDRFMITNMLGVRETGIYTVGLQIGSIVTLLADSFNKAYAPWLYEKLSQNDEKIKLKIVMFTYAYFFTILIFAVLLGFLSPLFLPLLVGNSFVESSGIILWIALGGALSGMYYMVVNYIFYVYKTHILTFITLMSGVLNIPATYFLVKYFNITGAAYSYALILFFQFLLTFALSVKVYKMPWFKFKAMLIKIKV